MEINQRRQSRLARRKNKRRKIIVAIRRVILLIIMFIVSYISYGIYKEGSIRTLASNEGNKNLLETEKKSEISLNDMDYNKKVITMPEVEVAKKYKGYEVECRLEIPKIELNTNVLKKYSAEGLDVCVSKYYGPNANEVGNYCIAGHNYNKENMFNHLIDLEIGDSIFLTDNQNGIVEYTIYDMYKVKPQNTEPLSQKTNGKRELTLITCVNYSRNRLVVKAVERENYEQEK